MTEQIGNLTIDRDYRDAGRAPLYHRYPGQATPQRAYIELTEAGAVSVSYDAEIGNPPSVPSYVWNGRTRRYAISEHLSVTGIDTIIAVALPYLERIHADLEVVWNGSNHVGRLTDAGRDAEESLSNALLAEDWDTTEVWSTTTYLDNTAHRDGETWYLDGLDKEISAGTMDDELQAMADAIEAGAEDVDIYLDGDVFEALAVLRYRISRVDEDVEDEYAE